MDIYEKIQEAGLTGNEARVYLELIKKGELTANQIARNISMDRTLTYTVLNHLIEKGQVSYVIKENNDGSVSCIVGGIDLPSRTVWRIYLVMSLIKLNTNKSIIRMMMKLS